MAKVKRTQVPDPPRLISERTYGSKRELRGMFTQKGTQRPVLSVIRPSVQRLYEYERISHQDTAIHAALGHLVKALLSSVGPITHPDPEIAEFLNYNTYYMEDQIGSSFQKILYDICFTTLWAGFSVSENLYNLHNSKLVLENIVTYHPNTILIRPDRYGMLRDGKPTFDSHIKSGIYQVPTNVQPEVRIPLWKAVYVANCNTFANFYGQSLIAPVYKWFRLKEVLVDMMATALDRYGSPMLYISSPTYPTGDTELDPATGEEKSVTTLDLLQKQIENLQGNGNVIFLPQQDGTNKPSIGTLTTPSNLGSTFLDAIAYCSEQAVLAIGIPFFLISSEVKENFEASERRMEVYQSVLEYHRRQLLRPIIKQAFQKLIEYNFNRSSAKVRPEFTRVYSDRPEDRVATMQMLTGLTELGYLNPKHETDWQSARQMVKMAERRLEKEDVEYIDLLREQYQKPTPATQGQGGGRPTGSSKPQQKARPKTKKKPAGSVTKRESSK